MGLSGCICFNLAFYVGSRLGSLVIISHHFL